MGEGAWMAFSSNRDLTMEQWRESQAGLDIMSAKKRNEEGAAAPYLSRDVKLEQEKLSGVVKSVHRSLRRKYREAGDFEKVWLEHCKDEGRLCEYAVAMKNLADSHWAKKCEGEGRIEWCLSVCQDYFYNGGKRKAIEKDARRAALKNCQSPSCDDVLFSTFDFSNVNTPNIDFHHQGKIRLLDVGSCYNPFLKYDDILAVGIDIVPAVETVYKCDFLNLQIQQPLQLAPDAIDAFLKQLKSPIDYLPAELFHVVVFSLLLSYFPSRYQRWICCKKAHELLALNGLLLIITPDSSHQNRHAMMMKSWKIAIESLGFKRMTYCKFSHMHLMSFRKVSLKTTSDLITRNYPDMLYIPQDFNCADEEECASLCCARSEHEDEQLACTFSELPDTPYDSDSGESQTSSMSFYEFEEPILLLT
ncbi:S-adenosylmethionine sensor upstream of mTORC1 [Spea bombifrons]|uniref:S-adenosylmethionine sensor upstream of mTORC1 n=1 Tax=Spea bombifrons TaxID=233779 RepID=UPI00234BFFE7|nr:S-adenosylmethionine sensor upstream of mTORC1 [Spea bombifrons]